MKTMVSINCITFNHEAYIAEAIESFLMQVTDFEFEILIGEDCSTDDTKGIVNKYIEKYPNKIRLITSDKNVGGRMNMVRLQNESQGKYIAICEGDDYWIDPYKLQKQVDYLEENPKCTLCFHNALLVKANKKAFRKLAVPLIKKNNYYRAKNGNYNAGELALLNFIPTASFIYPKYIMDHPPEWYFTGIVGDVAIRLITTSHGYAHYIDENMSVYRTGVKDSATYNWRKESSNKDSQTFIYNGLIDLLNNFNEYTQGKYQSDIDKSKIPFELELVRLEKQKKTLRNLRYRQYFQKAGLKEKAKYSLKYNFPNLYILVTRIKAYI